MKKCVHCGNQMKDEDMYCGSCGTPVAGEAEKKPRATVQNPDIQMLNEHLKQVKDTYLGMTVKPLSTIKYTSITMKLQASSILILFIAVINGLLNMWFVKQFTSYIQDGKNIFNRIISVSGMAKGLFQRLYAFMEGRVSYGAIFSYSLIVTIILLLLLGLLIFLIGRYIAKFHITFGNALNVVAAGTVPLVNNFLIYLILTNISRILGNAFLIVGIIIALLCMFNGVKEIFEDMEDSAAFTVTASLVVFYIITSLTLRLIIETKIRVLLHV